MSAKMMEKHRRVLDALNEETQPDGECCVPFRVISQTSGIIDVREVRRITRLLARKGMAQYWRGLFTDGGMPAGSGYCITDAGRDLLSALTKENAHGK